jgi:hypothetical protein
MDDLKRRNPPKTSKTSKTENFNAEILHSPYREGMVEGNFAEVAVTTRPLDTRSSPSQRAAPHEKVLSATPGEALL